MKRSLTGSGGSGSGSGSGGSGSGGDSTSKRLKTVFFGMERNIFVAFCLVNLFCSFTSSYLIEPSNFVGLQNNQAVTSNSIAHVRGKAPDFVAEAVLNGKFINFKLSDYHGKYLVLFFYPLDFTFVCPTEIIAFSDRIQEFKKLNCEVAAISVDSKYTHLAWINTPRKDGGLGDNLSIPLISDITKKISKDYGVLLEEGEETGVALRGLFIISNEGIIRQITINDLPVGRNVDEVLRLVQAFQFADSHPGEVCPVNWKPNISKAMHSDPQKSKEYFQHEFKN